MSAVPEMLSLMDGDFESLRGLFRRWLDLRAARATQGALRPSPEEVAALAAFVDARSALTAEALEAWGSIQSALENDSEIELCRCGHPLTHHHSDDRSCFHIVGCSTFCPCNAYEL